MDKAGVFWKSSNPRKYLNFKAEVSKYGSYRPGVCNRQRWARATFFGVRKRNSATCRKNFRNRNSATFKETLLRNRNSAIAIFSDVRNFKLPFRNFRHIEA
jgi:hypothetical protein